MALAIPSDDPEDRASVLYELGSLAEELGDWPGALGAYEKIQEIDPAFRDLPVRIKQAQTNSGG